MLSMTRSFFCFVFFAFCCSFADGASCVWAAQSVARNASEWSDLIQKRYEEVTSMVASFDQTIVHKESGVTEKRKGEIQFKKPMLVRWETEPPTEELLVVNDEMIWQYFPDEKLAYQFSKDMLDSQNAFIMVLLGQIRLDKGFAITQQDDDGKLATLLLYPNNPTQNMVEATVWVEPGSGLIKRLKITDFYGNTSEIGITKQSLNQKLKSSVFTFTPPKGTDVENQRGAASR